MSTTLAQDNATELVKALVGIGGSKRSLIHDLTKGELRELDVSDILERFLTSQFSVGSGVVINRDNVQSRQTDIVVYDNRIIPPIVEKNGRGVYPVESVIATVSVRTELDRAGVKEAEEAAECLSNDVVGRYAPEFPPLHAAFGFAGGVRGLGTQKGGQRWFEKEKIRRLFNICIAGKYCWANVGTKGWTIGTDTSDRYNETKRFLALLLDNVRTRGEARYQHFLKQGHRDWFSRYIRD